MRVEMDSMLRVCGAPPATDARLRSAATFPNPAHAKLLRLGRDARWTPATLPLWQRDGAALVLPRGLLHELRTADPACPVEDRRLTLPEVDFRWRGALRPEQREAAARAWRAHGGVVVGPCGSGKTNMGLACVGGWRQPALWVVHTLDLARQALERARTLFDLPDDAFGMIGGGRESIGTHLTAATVQTLARRDLADLAGRFGTVVLDEAHHAPASTFMQVLQAFAARNRLGLTATPDRADGLGAAMLAVFGPIVARLTTQALAGAGRVVLPVVRQVPTSFTYRYADDYGALLAALIANAPRNALIARMVAAEARAGHCCLVLSERVDHCRLLAEALQRVAPEVPAAILTGEATAKVRAETLGAMRTGRLRVLCATRLADEGLDIPALDRVFLTTGGRNVVALTQRAGRAMRPADGKGEPIVFDFCDWRVGVLRAQVKARVRDVWGPLGARIVREAVPA